MGAINIVGAGADTIICSTAIGASVLTLNAAVTYNFHNVRFVTQKTDNQPQYYGIYMGSGVVSLYNCSISAPPVAELAALITVAGNAVFHLRSPQITLDLNGGNYAAILYVYGGEIELVCDDLLLQGDATVSLGCIFANNRGTFARKGNVRGLVKATGMINCPSYQGVSLSAIIET